MAKDYQSYKEKKTFWKSGTFRFNILSPSTKKENAKVKKALRTISKHTDNAPLGLLKWAEKIDEEHICSNTKEGKGIGWSCWLYSYFFPVPKKSEEKAW